MSLTVMSPDLASYQIDTVHWANGSIYSKYLTTPAENSALSTQGPPEQNVDPDSTTYTFIVDPKVRDYSIEVTVHYKDGNGNPLPDTGKAEVTFTSVRPTTATLKTANVLGDPTYNHNKVFPDDPNSANEATIMLYDEARYDADPKIRCPRVCTSSPTRRRMPISVATSCSSSLSPLVGMPPTAVRSGRFPFPTAVR